MPPNWSLAIAFLAGWGIVPKFLYYLLLAVFLYYVSSQVRKPRRWIGLIFAWIMNFSHSNLTDWGLSHVKIENNFVALDVGCGGGRTIQKLAALAPDGTVYGADYAKGSVAASRAKNAGFINAGRVQIYPASVSRLPFPDNQFDLVTAVETQYYWPDLPNDMREIRRVLKPGGTLLIIAETYKGGRYDWLKGPVMKALRSTFLSVKEQQDLFAVAGYTKIEVFEERTKGWICAMGSKPDDSVVWAPQHTSSEDAPYRSISE